MSLLLPLNRFHTSLSLYFHCLLWTSKCRPQISTYPTDIYLFKINNGNTRKRCEIRLKWTIMTPNNVNGVVLMSLLLTLNIFYTFFSVFIVYFEQVNVCWVVKNPNSHLQYPSTVWQNPSKLGDTIPLYNDTL